MSRGKKIANALRRSAEDGEPLTRGLLESATQYLQRSEHDLIVPRRQFIRTANNHQNVRYGLRQTLHDELWPFQQEEAEERRKL